MQEMTLAEKFAGLQARLNDASGKWGGVTICAVTKTVDAATVNTAYAAGARIIGENRVQEAMEKLPLLNKNFRLHIIGQLQTNKVKYLMPAVEMVQSLDRDALAEEISRRAVAAGRTMDVLVQVNIAKEASKTGIFEEDLDAFLKRTAERDGICIKGLMAIMPNVPDPEEVRGYFRRMRMIFDAYRDKALKGITMETLSMGMSHDAMVAAEEGATMVRLGTALFGKRETTHNDK